MKPATMSGFSPKKSRAKRVDREGAEQSALMTEIKLRYPEIYANLHHTPNVGIAAGPKPSGSRPKAPSLAFLICS